MRYVLFNKPYGVLSQFTALGRWRSLAEFGLPPRVYAAGRLDADSEGLLLLTDDGALIQALLGPHSKVEKTYVVQVEGRPEEATLEELRNGVLIEGRRTLPCSARLLEVAPAFPERSPPVRVRKQVGTSWVEIRLREGRNRQVRRMTASVGHPTLRLVRIAIGAFELGDLLPGRWVELSRNRVGEKLRRSGLHVLAR